MRLASPAVSGTASATSSAAAASSRAKIRGSLSRASCGATTVTYHSAKGISVAGADSTATASAPPRQDCRSLAFSNSRRCVFPVPWPPRTGMARPLGIPSVVRAR